MILQNKHSADWSFNGAIGILMLQTIFVDILALILVYIYLVGVVFISHEALRAGCH